MNIFGYEVDSEAETPMAMREITFEGSSEELLRLADFLRSASRQMAEHEDDVWHTHLRDCDPEWVGPSDVIVVRPRKR